MFGVSYGKRFGLEMALAIRMEDDRVGVGQTLNHPYPAILHPNGSGHFQAKPFPV